MLEQELLKANKISSVEFVDLYLSSHFSEFKGLKGSHDIVTKVPDNLIADAMQLYIACREKQKDNVLDEFTLIYDDILYRVSGIVDMSCEYIYILRRSTAALYELGKLSLPPYIHAALINPKLQGLVLVAGKMGMGKTSTAASIVSDRLKRFGGVAMVIEDPVETKLNGLHGSGRCIQVAASPHNGGYPQQLFKAMRSGADLIMIGEIRDKSTARQVLQASINGHLIVSTIHAGSVGQAIERLISISEMSGEGTKLLSEGLSLVIHQNIFRTPDRPGSNRLIAEGLDFCFSENGKSARVKVRDNKVDLLANEMSQQMNKAQWRT